MVLTVIAVVLVSVFANVREVSAQDFKWFRGGGSTDDLSSSYYIEGSYFMCTDPNGNVYSLNMVGNNSIVADTFHTGAYGSLNNILLTSYNCSGQLRWAKLLASNSADLFPLGFTVDSIGHIYVAGIFPHGSFHIGSDTVVPTGHTVAATIQLDTLGHYNWIRYVGQNTIAGEAASTLGYGSIFVDSLENVHFLKLFKPGCQITSTTTSVYGTYDLTYNTAGTLLRVQQLQLDSTWGVKGAAIDRYSQKLYLFSEYNNTLSSSIFKSRVASFDTSRSLIWLDSVVSTTGNGVFSGITTDGIGHVYFAGCGQGNIYFAGDTVFGMSGSNAFIAKADTACHLKWMRGLQGTLYNDLYAFTLLPGNKMAATGTILGTIASDGYSLTSYAGETYNPYFTVLDTGGYVHTLQQIHGSGSQDHGTSIASDRVGNLYFGGVVIDSVWGGSATGYRTHGGNSDFFIMKYGVDCSCSSMPIAYYVDTASSHIVGGDTVRFAYTGTTAGTDSVRWNFGDGGTSTVTNPVHIYTAAGSFTACVTVYSSCGNDLHCTDIFVPCVAAPTAAFTGSGISATRNFTYTSSSTGLDSVVWHFGDGGHSVGLTASRTYTAIGTYTACVTSYNPCGYSTTCSTFTVPCIAPPAASFTASGTTAIRSFSYTGTTVALDSVVWHFGDGGHATGLTASHTYSATGTVTVCVIAHSPCGVDSSCTTITIPCTSVLAAAFTHSGVPPAINCNYSGTSTAMDSVVWHFGDGSHSTGTTASHTYSAVGTYTVCALAYNPCGVDSTCSTVTVPCVSAPVASFSTTGTSPINCSYTGTAVALDSVAWNFGDGGHAIGLTASHTYAVPDTYLICVTAYNPCGFDSACTTVIIPCDTPIAAFTHSGTVAGTFNYTGTTTGIDSVVWIFGDGNIGHGNIASHSYATSGTYHVCVIAYTNCSVDSVCSDVYFTGTLVNPLSVNSIQVFPNPATDEIIISGIVQPTAYKLLNVTGICLRNGILQAGSNSLLMKNYSPGIYVLELTDSSGVKSVVRIIKD